ncbi:hypothetical protein J6590_045381 [Homalodisca vitripennis]|nr:hypothetical protein J6590_045381 [Homalodisca vitripennis]
MPDQLPGLNCLERANFFRKQSSLPMLRHELWNDFSTLLYARHLSIKSLVAKYRVLKYRNLTAEVCETRECFQLQNFSQLD